MPVRVVDATSQVRRLGQASGTGADGRTRVAPSNQPLAVFASRKGLFGCSKIEVFDADEHIVALSNRDLTVEVVDAAG